MKSKGEIFVGSYLHKDVKLYTGKEESRKYKYISYSWPPGTWIWLLSSTDSYVMVAPSLQRVGVDGSLLTRSGSASLLRLIPGVPTCYPR